MQKREGFHINVNRSFYFSVRFLAILFVMPGWNVSHAQVCPPNIDFETGTFTNWTCYAGSVSGIGGQNFINIYSTNGPVSNRHTLYSRLQNGNERDPYGNFPVVCPNGSGYSMRLGNDEAGGQAEGISYEFTIPPNQNNYSLIYHYAVVFQDPNHQIFQQPRLELEITNVTDNQVIHCSSFIFIPHGSILPGFFISPVQRDTTNIWCKDWSAVSINLNGNAGKTIRLFFKTADCTFIRHFGYAYIDVNTECSSEFVGDVYCPQDTAIQITAPWGYQNYTWYNNGFSQKLGSDQTLRFEPPPPLGTTVAVEVVPYNGYGCLDTLYTTMVDTLKVISQAGRDTLSCNREEVQIGLNPKPGFSYSWSPPEGLSNPAISNPVATPSATTHYVLTTRSQGGGCANNDTVLVVASIIDTTISVLGKEAFCVTSGDSAVLSIQPAKSIQWYKDNLAIPGATRPTYKVIKSGVYKALLFNDDGCSIETSEKNITIEDPIPGIVYPVQYAIVEYPLQLTARDFGVKAEWAPTSYLDSSTTFTPLFNGAEDILYTVTIETKGGCVTIDTQMVKIAKELKVYVPTAFTPNNDGLNDYLKPIPMGFKELKYFRIYNRWGQFIFDIRSNPRGWDGTVGGKPQSSQVFVWIAEGIGVDNKVYKEKGTAVLIR